jgi:serine/threonine protein kinase/tetratricopeptide (TPR) repeat protein
MTGFIGGYQIIRSLGKGGMGEVFLVHDPVCGRFVALKRIRQDLNQNKTMQSRFLREAKIAALLTHPSIIPIYAISQEMGNSFYTMPYVEGETLREILRTAKQEEKEGKILHHIGSSIPALIRIFLNVCQAIAYSHAKGILHRDLKPENIIVGKYGEVLILDWGLADFIEQPTEEMAERFPTFPDLIAGTIAFMAPERALGKPATTQTDIYSLGVMLYQLLTLHLPFKRSSLQTFRKMMKHERLIDPSETAPYRDIPLQLEDIVKRCLSPSTEHRYQNTLELIADLEDYIEGRPEWIPTAHLSIDNKNDWEFQENILLAKHIAITGLTDVMEWVSLMLSKAAFSGNIRITAKVRFGPTGRGMGFLLNIPTANSWNGLEEGYCLWIGSHLSPICTLFRSNVEVMGRSEVRLLIDTWHEIRIEKLDNRVSFYLDDALQFNYISHVPMTGTHVGILYRDADFQLEECTVSIGSQNVMVNCLAIPDAFLADKQYAKALAEYRRIGGSFAGRAEGREALFRAGITLLEQSKEGLCQEALEEFGKLHGTAGAPLEYLGKSLVYKAAGDIEEEIKCLELALRKYPRHPLVSILAEHVIFRLHEASYYNRLAAYHFALLALRHLPQIFSQADHRNLLESLKKHCWPLPFIVETQGEDSSKNSTLAVQLAFWLAKPITLMEIIESGQEIENALFALLELGCHQLVKEHLSSEYPQAELALKCHEKGIEKILRSSFSELEPRTLVHLFETALNTHQAALILPYFDRLEKNLPLDTLHIWALLLTNQWEKAGHLLETYPLEQRMTETSPLYPLFGCWLFATEGEEIAMRHFTTTTPLAFPPIPSLLSHYLMGKIDLEKGWISEAFFWEKIQLWRQLILFYHCAENPEMQRAFEKRLSEEERSIESLYIH